MLNGSPDGARWDRLRRAWSGYLVRARQVAVCITEPGRIRRVRRALAGLCLLIGLWDGWQQWEEQQRLPRIARDVIQTAGAWTRGEQVVALRDFVRRRVSAAGAPVLSRTLLRPAAAEILDTGKGFCGEATRLFLCLAAGVEIPARRVYLYGSRAGHVVPEVELSRGKWVLADCTEPPLLPDLLPMEQVLATTEFRDFARLRLFRAHVAAAYQAPDGRESWLERISKHPPGGLSLVLESPHGISAGFWIGLAGVLLLARRRQSPSVQGTPPGAAPEQEKGPDPE